MANKIPLARKKKPEKKYKLMSLHRDENRPPKTGNRVKKLKSK